MYASGYWADSSSSETEEDFMTVPCPYYAVAVGRTPGIYTCWLDCQDQVLGYSRAEYRKFYSRQDAEDFLSEFYDQAQRDGYYICDSCLSYDPHRTWEYNGAPGRAGSYRNQGHGMEQAHRANNRAEIQKAVKRSEDINAIKDSLTSLKQTFASLRQHYQPSPPEADFPYYAVAVGRSPGIYRSWEECKKQVHQYSRAQFRKFESKAQAEAYLAEHRKQSTQPKSARIYTDGSCLHNGYHNASAGIGVFWGHGDHRNVSERACLYGRQTSNRAEIQAAIRALQQCKQQGITKVTIVCDSDLLKRGATEWIENWKVNNWRKANGAPVVNMTDWQQLLDAEQGLQVHYEHVPAHCGEDGNEAADRLARAGAQAR